MPLRHGSFAHRRIVWLSIILLAAPHLALPSAQASPPTADPGQLGFDAEKLNAIDAVVEKGIADGEMPGAVICVGRSAGIAFLRAYGRRQVQPVPEPMTTDTVFDLASLTKPVATATAVMRLAQDGKLSPDDPVAKHLPEFGTNGKEAITVSQLLTHTSSLIPDNALTDYDFGPDETWRRIFALAPISAPGTAFKYSDVNFLVLGKLVERVSGGPLNVYCRETIFIPLGMAETGFLPADDLKRRCAPTDEAGELRLKGVVHDPRAAKLDRVAGHAGLFSTAADLATYSAALLQTLRERDRTPQISQPERVLSRAAVERMTMPHDLPGDVRRTYGWDFKSGYSINRGQYFSNRAFGHGGFTGTVLWIDPELDLYVIWLSNRLHPDGHGTVNPLAGKVGTIAADALFDRSREELPGPDCPAPRPGLE